MDTTGAAAIGLDLMRSLSRSRHAKRYQLAGRRWSRLSIDRPNR